MSTLAGFRDKLQVLINEHSMENGSDTPDFILAEFLTDCLATFDKTMRERERWYSRDKPRLKIMPDGRVREVRSFDQQRMLPENDDHE